MNLEIYVSDEKEIMMKYSDKDVKIDYASLELLIDYLMDNKVKVINLNSPETLNQYKNLILKIHDEIKKEDFISAYNSARNN